ncbi:LysE family transporter [bacterium]|nr:LysE family transporter [bacterium]
MSGWLLLDGLDWTSFLKGAVIGLSVAAPVGPIGLLCIRRTLTQGRRVGFVSGLGATGADTLYGLVAALGLSSVSGWLLGMRPWLHLLGALFLIVLGWRTLQSSPATKAATLAQEQYMGAFATTFLLTISNPMTILSFAAVFAGMGLGSMSERGAGLLLVAGVCVGSALWWLLLSVGVGMLAERLDMKILRWTNRLSGLIILSLGLLALVTLRF